MRILIVSPVFYPESFRINDLAEELAKRGHQVQVLAGHPNYPEGRYFPGFHAWGPWRELWGKVDILRFPQIPRRRGHAWELALNYLSFALAGGARVLLSGDWAWDAVFVFQITPVTAALPALLARNLSGARSVIWVQDLWPDSIEAVGLRLPKLLAKFVARLSEGIYRSFDGVLGQNEAFLSRLEAMGVEPARMACVHQWADEDEPFHQDQVPILWDSSFTVFFAGNLGRAQGLETVLNAAEQLRDEAGLRWVLMGDGSLRSWLETEIRRRDLSDVVQLPGRRPSSEMAVYYARAQVLLISLRRAPTLTRTLPGKLQAYLAAGRPILGVVEGVAAQVIENSGSGVVVPPEDAKALAEGVLRLRAMSDAERAELGASGKLWYRDHYSRAVCVNQIEEALARH